MWRIGIIFVISVGQNSPVRSHVGLNFSLWKIDFTNSISLLDIDQFRYFYFFWILSEIIIFHWICPFHVSCHIYWHKDVHNITLLYFNVYEFGIEVPLSSLILIMCILSFKEINPAKTVSILLIFSVNQFSFHCFSLLFALFLCHWFPLYYFLFIKLILFS